MQLIFSLLHSWRFFLPVVLRGFREDLFYKGDDGLLLFFSLGHLFFFGDLSWALRLSSVLLSRVVGCGAPWASTWLVWSLSSVGFVFLRGACVVVWWLAPLLQFFYLSLSHVVPICYIFLLITHICSHVCHILFGLRPVVVQSLRHLLCQAP